jgi:hypothetical protein
MENREVTVRKRLYLHIGQHKTGTSTIQSFFWHNRDQLKVQGLMYPEVGLSGPTHGNLALSLPSQRDAMVAEMFSHAATDRSGSYSAYAGESADQLYAELGEQIEATECSRVLLSSECFMEWLDPTLIKQMLDRYCQCEIKVILILRRQDQWIQSVFNQVVKDPGLRYAGALEALPQIAMLDYRKTVGLWAEAFGQDALVIKDYAEISNYQYGVLGYFAEIVGMSLTDDLEFPSFQERNISLSGWQIDVLHDLNKRNASLDVFQAALAAFLKMNEDEPAAASDTVNGIDYKAARSLYRRYKRDNNKLSAVFMSRKALFSSPNRREYPKLTPINYATIADFLVRLKV